MNNPHCKKFDAEEIMLLLLLHGNKNSLKEKGTLMTICYKLVRNNKSYKARC